MEKLQARQLELHPISQCQVVPVEPAAEPKKETSKARMKRGRWWANFFVTISNLWFNLI